MIKIKVENTIKVVGLEDKFEKAVRKAMTLPNPKYYTLKNMNKSVYNVPEFFHYFKSTKEGIRIPRGARQRLIDMLDRYNKDYEVVDNTIKNSTRVLNDCDPIELRDYQKPILEKIENNDYREGVWRIDTGAGKTVMAIEYIRRKGARSTIFVHNNTLLNQWKEELEKFFDYTPGIVNGEQKNIKAITIASFATCRNREDLLEKLANQTEIVFVDEAHGVVAKTRQKVINKMKPHRIFGLTGTAERTDQQTEAIFFYCGQKIVEFDMDKIEPVVDVVNTKIELPKTDEYHKDVEAMVNHEGRNKLISGIVTGNVLEGRKVLVLTKRIEHFKKIKEFLGEREKFYYISGETEDKEMLLDGMKKGVIDYNAIFGTIALLSTGTDIPSLDTLIIACDMNSSVLMKQSVGRILRMEEDKKKPKVIDIADITRGSNPTFKKQFYNRQDVYKKKGWKMI